MGTIYVHMDFLKESKLDASAPVLVTPSVPNARTLGETPGENPAVTPGMPVVEDVTNNNTHFLQDVFGVVYRKLNKDPLGHLQKDWKQRTTRVASLQGR